MIAKTPPPIAAPRTGTAVAGAKPSDADTDADEAASPAVRVAPDTSDDTLARADEREDATSPREGKTITLANFQRPRLPAANALVAGRGLPVAVASAALILCFARLCADSTLASAFAIWLFKLVCAARPLDSTAALWEACAAASPESVCAATWDDIRAASCALADAAASEAAAAIEAATSVASVFVTCADTSVLAPLRAARRMAETRML